AHGGVREQLEALFPKGLVPVGDTDAVVRKVLEWRHEPPPVRELDRFTLQCMQQATLALYAELSGPYRDGGTMSQEQTRCTMHALRHASHKDFLHLLFKKMSTGEPE
ncbi:MAG: hypothetical protein D6791_09705, partial [Chloroflexi bacterium]